MSKKTLEHVTTNCIVKIRNNRKINQLLEEEGDKIS